MPLDLTSPAGREWMHRGAILAESPRHDPNVRADEDLAIMPSGPVASGSGLAPNVNASAATTVGDGKPAKKRRLAAKNAPEPTSAARPFIIDDDSDIEVIENPAPRGPILTGKQKLAAENLALKSEVERIKAEHAEQLAGLALVPRPASDENAADAPSPEALRTQLAVAQQALRAMTEKHALEIDKLQRQLAEAPSRDEWNELRKTSHDTSVKLNQMAQATSKLNTVREALECSICMETFSGPKARWDRQPKQLPCGHVFCCLPVGRSCPMRCPDMWPGTPQSNVWPNRPLQQILDAVGTD